MPKRRRTVLGCQSQSNVRHTTSRANRIDDQQVRIESIKVIVLNGHFPEGLKQTIHCSPVLKIVVLYLLKKKADCVRF